MKPLIIALDVESDKEALSLLRATKRSADVYKVGPALLLRYGPAVLKKIRAQGKKIFLDLKFHDIPNTMMRSIREAGRNGIYSATVHASAGINALRAVSDVGRRPRLWGVTVLTSLTAGDLSQLGFRHAPGEQVSHLAALARQGGLDGIVASVGETATLRKALGPQFTIVTPGIRMPGDAAGDQKRIATPQHARLAGASYFVVGRPILESRDPGRLADLMLADWKRGAEGKVFA